MKIRTTLERTGHEVDLQTVAATRQMEFLVDLGLGEQIAALSAPRAGNRTRRP